MFYAPYFYSSNIVISTCYYNDAFVVNATAAVCLLWTKRKKYDWS